MTISSSSHLAPEEVARHSFGSMRRGYNVSEVRAYLESIANGLRGIAEREHQLLQELADAEHRAAHPVLDEATLSAAVGDETARVLQSAHEAAADMVARAQAEADRVLSTAHQEIEKSWAENQDRLAQLTATAEAAANELRERASQDATAQLEAARNEGEEMLDEARDRCRDMVEEAQGLRARILADLSKRRRVLHAQIEQLRAGRERLAEAVTGVRRSIDTIAEDLSSAEDNARLAAEAAGREALDRSEEGTPEELAALLLEQEHRALAPDQAGQPELEVAAQAVDVIEVVDIAGVAEGVANVEIDPGGAVDATEAAGSAETSGPERDGAGSPEVEALFARIRADREQQEIEDPSLDESESDEEPGGLPPGTPGAPEVATDAGEQGAAETDGEGTGAEEADSDEPDGPPVDRNPLAVRRDELVAPVVRSLSRRLKRTLQDEQNDLLDRLRSNGSRWSGDLLPDLTEQMDSYATAALPMLEEAAVAGVSFAGTKKPSRPSVDQLLAISHELAEAVVAPLRRRLSDDARLVDAEESAVAEHVGSAFREWKGERIERLAGDQVLAAFSAGTIAAAKGKKSIKLEWVADPGTGDAPCPDCEDNSLNGSLKPDEEFPTGHRHPPAHPGCRCLLAVSAT